VLEQALQKAMLLQRNKNFAEAETIYVSLIAQAPNDVNCRYLFGTLLHEQHRYKQAHTHLSIAYRLVPNNADVVYAFSKNALKIQSKSDVLHAITPFLNINRKIFRLYVSTLSISELNVLVTNAVNNRFWQNYELGKHFYNLQYFEEARALISQAYRVSPDEEDISTLLAHCLSKTGYYSDAIKLYESLARRSPKNFDVHFNRGVALYNRGERELANQSLKRALALKAGHAQASIYLSTSHYELANIDESLKTLETALEKTPNSIVLQAAWIDLLIQTENIDDAEQYISSLSRSRQLEEPICILFSRLCWQRDKCKSLSLLQNHDYRHSVGMELIKRYLQLGYLEQANKTLKSFYDISANTVEWKALCHTYSRLQKKALQAPLEEYRFLVQSFDLSNNLDQEQCNALALYLRNRHSHATQPKAQSVKDGTQVSGVLFDAENPVRDALLRCINQCFDEYQHSIEDRSCSYLLLPDIKGKKLKIREGWSINLAEGGYHAYHVHQEGALSAVFYVDLPIEIDKDDNAGYLGFGVPEFSLDEPLEPEYVVMPKKGRLVVFPSHFWHGTIPFSSETHRLTIAFDVEAL